MEITNLGLAPWKALNRACFPKGHSSGGLCLGPAQAEVAGSGLLTTEVTGSGLVPRRVLPWPYSGGGWSLVPQSSQAQAYSHKGPLSQAWSIGGCWFSTASSEVEFS